MPARVSKSIELLLNENVEGLGIVGDVVKVRPGFARNYLLPLGIAEAPSAERIEALKEARAAAQAELEKTRAVRKGIIEALTDKSIELIRSCNDRGILYGSVTQRDIADALKAMGHIVDERAIRLAQPIRRLGDSTVIVQFEKEMRAELSITVIADRSLAEEMEEMEFDNDGELIEKPAKDSSGESEPSSESEEPVSNEHEEPVEAAAENG